MRASVVVFASFVMLGVSLAQRPTARATHIPTTTQKSGAWETLKLVNTAPTPNDARNFGVALPIGNGRLGAREQSIGDLLRRSARRLPNRTAIRCGDTVW